MLTTKAEAAAMLQVPIAWIDGMIEIGALTPSKDYAGNKMIDADEIIDKGFVSPRFRAASLRHVEEMLRKTMSS